MYTNITLPLSVALIDYTAHTKVKANKLSKVMSGTDDPSRKTFLH